MNLSELTPGQEIYSVSMGRGKVLSITNDAVNIDHGGKPWRYSLRLIRSGCMKSDLVLSEQHVYLNQTTISQEKWRMVEEIANVVEKYVD